MKWYRLINCSSDDDGCLLVQEEDLLGYDWLNDFCNGVPLASWPGRGVLRATNSEWNGEAYDFLSTVYPFPVFSQRLRDVLHASHIADNDFQYLPVDVYRVNGELIEGYAIANAIVRLPVLAEGESFMVSKRDELDPLTGKQDISGVGKPAIYGDRVKGHDAFRLLEFLPVLLISERFVDVVRKHKLTGAYFSNVKVV